MAKENKAGRGADIVRREKIGSKVQSTPKIAVPSSLDAWEGTWWVVGDALNFSVPRKK